MLETTTVHRFAIGVLCVGAAALAGCGGDSVTWLVQPGPGPLDFGAPIVADSGDVLLASRVRWGRYAELQDTIPVLVGLGSEGQQTSFHQLKGFTWFEAWPRQDGSYMFAGGDGEVDPYSRLFRAGHMAGDGTVLEEHTVAWPDDIAVERGELSSGRLAVRVNDAGETFIVGHKKEVVPIELDNEAFAYKFDAKGELSWTWQLAAPGQASAAALDVREDGGIVIAGHYAENEQYVGFVVELDAMGAERAHAELPAPFYPSALLALPDGGSLVSSGEEKVHVWRLDAAGKEVWAWSPGAEAKIRGMAVAPSGEIALTGLLWSGDLGFGAVSVDGAAPDMLFVELDQNGVALAEKHFGHHTINRALTAWGSSGEVYVSAAWDMSQSDAMRSEITVDGTDLAGKPFYDRGYDVDSVVLRIDP